MLKSMFCAFPFVKTSYLLRLRIVALLLVKDDGDLLLMLKPWCATVKYCSRWERLRLVLGVCFPYLCSRKLRLRVYRLEVGMYI